MILYLILCLILAVVFGGSYYAYRVAFYATKSEGDKVPSISGPEFDPYREEIRRVYRKLKEMPFEEVSIRSREGLTLSGKYYHVADDAPVALCFHGYRSSSLIDFCGGSELCFELGQNVLLVDQRAHGKSGGRTITFGIRERQDLLCWIDYILERFGQNAKIILYGVSMGGATVLMASELDLPQNVKCIIADCPYSAPLDIILHVGKNTMLPHFLIKPFVILGAKIYGGFDIRESDALRAVKNTKIPILLIHGEADSFVPCSMSHSIAASAGKKVSLHTFPNANHAISFLVDSSRYRKLVTDFLAHVL